jgi:hypothetical protein
MGRPDTYCIALSPQSNTARMLRKNGAPRVRYSFSAPAIVETYMPSSSYIMSSGLMAKVLPAILKDRLGTAAVQSTRYKPPYTVAAGEYSLAMAAASSEGKIRNAVPESTA